MIASGNCAFVTKNVLIFRECNSLTNFPISGYMIGSPTRDNAQCLGFIPSSSFSGKTPGTPFICFTILQCSETAASTSSKGSSICQRHVFPTGFV